MKTIPCLAKLTIGATLLVISLPGMAACTGTTHIFNRSYSATTLMVPRHAMPGTPIGSAELISSGMLVPIDNGCTSPFYRMSRYGTTMTPVPAGGGIPVGVYETNLPGIGIQVWEKSSSTYINNNLETYSSKAGYGFSLIGVMLETYMQLIVTGPVSAGTVTFPSPFIEGWIGQAKNSTSGAAKHTVFNIANVTIKLASCTTPDITVNLGKHNRGEFIGLNSTSAATPFNFEIQNCDPGMNSVSYTFKPAAGVTLVGANTDAHQHLTLDSSSSATGVGVQVLYSDNTRVKFHEKIKYTGYNKTSGGSYVIPMKARYIQTASTVTGGEANSALEFTMTYE